MGIFEKMKNMLPKRFRKNDGESGLKNNLPKEKENITKSFAVYCNANHGTERGKLCAKCNALLMTIFPKMNRCKYGLTKPICDKCEEQCFGDAHSKAFMEIMDGSRKKMLVKHPMMTVRHKIVGIGVDYARQKQNDEAAQKDEDKRKKKVAKARAKKAKKK